jgi:hypothetical protein
MPLSDAAAREIANVLRKYLEKKRLSRSRMNCLKFAGTRIFETRSRDSQMRADDQSVITSESDPLQTRLCRAG